MISHQYKCIFIHIPKCAGTSVEEALGHFDGFTAKRSGQDHRTIRHLESPLNMKHTLKNKSNLTLFLKRLKSGFTKKRILTII